jgi:hypothetical protein
MPAIKNYRERKVLKKALERSDQNVITYTYIFSEMTGKFTFIGESLGYGISASTKIKNPQKIAAHANSGYAILPQDDPNTLFSGPFNKGTWIMMYDPIAKEAIPQYIESRISVFSYKLPPRLVIGEYKD